MILLIDNYDSFTYNLAHLFGELGAEVVVRRNDAIDLDEAERLTPSHLVISPGPGRPKDAGVSVELVQRLGERVPTLGVCLGHQAMAQAFGGEVKLHPPVHGKATTVEHDGRTIFEGLRCPLRVGRYHSLIVDPALPDCLEQSAAGGGVLMGLRHRELPAEGVQFHPESILTEDGHELLANFLGQPKPTAGG
jgi:anthranilate synthase/aminodeoxychorismate synthase-like glutamine amidotransferase